MKPVFIEKNSKVLVVIDEFSAGNFGFLEGERELSHRVINNFHFS